MNDTALSKIFALSILLLGGCSSSLGSGASFNDASDGGAPATDPSSCNGSPKTQTVSASCCVGYGVDACGADLFCAAFDGRTQATCYPVHSRSTNETCTADVQCTSSACNTKVGKCEALVETACDPAVGCAPAPDGTAYACGSSGKCTPRGNGLNKQYCDTTSDCQSGVGLTCDTSAHSCVPASITTDQCQSEGGNDVRYGECYPAGGGSFTFAHACLESVQFGAESNTVIVACPAGLTCDDESEDANPFDFCQ